MRIIDPNTALANEEFHENVREAFFSSQEYADAFHIFYEKNFDSLVDEYWTEEVNE